MRTAATGAVLPIAEVQCDSVRRFIAADLGRTRSEQRDEILGRALGRVISHELYHILLRTTQHGREGIARPAQSSSDLVTERVAFARADELRLASVSDEALSRNNTPRLRPLIERILFFYSSFDCWPYAQMR